jgi:hypothetical protein
VNELIDTGERLLAYAPLLAALGTIGLILLLGGRGDGRS